MRPTRGEVWLFDLGMAAKTRPVVVVSVPFGDIDRAQSSRWFLTRPKSAVRRSRFPYCVGYPQTRRTQA